MQAEHIVERYVLVEEFSKGTELTCVHKGRGGFVASVSDVNRPAVQFAGYFEHFVFQRIQLFGNQEMRVVESLSARTLKERCRQFFEHDIPCVIVCNGDEVPAWLMRGAKKHRVPVFVSEHSSSTVVQYVVEHLNDVLAPTARLHANLIDVHNVGVLIRGESGMGKSELTLELVKRGHVMVSDDVTMIRKTSLRRLTGYAPEATKGLLEMRGLGIMDVRMVYGAASVLDRKDVQIIIDMEEWDQQKSYDRLGFDVQYDSLLGVSIPCYVMPVRPGRNLAVVVEATAMDYRMKRSGYDIEKEILRRFQDEF